MPAGRPSQYSPELAERLCDEIAQGRSLTKVCEEEAWAPSRSSVHRWLDTYPEFATRWARARELQADAMDDKILAVADETTEINAQSARVKIGAYQWRAEKLKPKVYGNRQQLDVAMTITEASEEDLMAELVELVSTGVLKLPAPSAEPDPNEDLL